MRLARKHVGAVHAVPSRRVFFLRAAEAIEPGRDAHAVKAQVPQERHELCLRQSAGDSARPEIDVAARALFQFHVEHDVRKLQPAARAQDAVYLPECFLFFRHQVEHAV